MSATFGSVDIIGERQEATRDVINVLQGYFDNFIIIAIHFFLDVENISMYRFVVLVFKSYE